MGGTADSNLSKGLRLARQSNIANIAEMQSPELGSRETNSFAFFHPPPALVQHRFNVKK